MKLWVRKTFATFSNSTRHRTISARRLLQAEVLGNRFVPATFTEAGQLLALDLNIGNETVAVVSKGTSYDLTLAGSNWTGSDSANVAGNGTSTLSVTASGIAAFTSGIAITDTAASTGVSFIDSAANAYFNIFTVTLNNGSIGVNFSGSSAFGDSSLDVRTDRNIVLNSGSAIATISGSVSLTANKGGTANGNLSGIALAAAQIASETGSITLDGTGGNSGVGNRGVFIYGGSVVRSTGVGSNAAKIMITGTGGPGTEANRGIDISEASTTVSSVDGSISLIGFGGNGSSVSNDGILVGNGAVVASTGTGADVASISMTGTGGTGTNYNRGISIEQGNATVTSIEGAIAIQGTGGNSTASFNDGVSVGQNGRVTSTATFA